MKSGVMEWSENHTFLIIVCCPEYLPGVVVLAPNQLAPAAALLIMYLLHAEYHNSHSTNKVRTFLRKREHFG